MKRKVAFYYGFINIKKFRFINNYSKRMPVNTNYGVKLECMLNIFMYRLNFFDNIFHINNVIKKVRIIEINNKICIYPYRVVNLFDTVSISKHFFKKMFNIFLKRSKYNKSYLLGKLIRKGKKKKKVMRNLINIPDFIEYNYKIMHFTMFDKPKIKQIKSLGYGLGETSLYT